MAKKEINTAIIKVVETFATEIKKHYKVDFVILFGSFAKGNQNEDSDIDVAIVSRDIKNGFDDSVKMMKVRRNIDLRIEPHAIKTEDYRNNATALINEIIKTGVQIYAA